MSDHLADRAVFPLDDIVTIAEFPLSHFLPPGQISQVMSHLYQAESRSDFDGENVITEFLLIYEEPLMLALPGFPELALRIAPMDSGRTAIRARLSLGPDTSLTLLEARIALRLPQTLLEDRDSGEPADITVEGDIEFSAQGIRFSRMLTATLPPAYLLDTEIVVAATRVRPLLNIEDLEETMEFQGLAFDLLRVTLPLDFLFPDDVPDLNLFIQGGLIDPNGFTGSLGVQAEDLLFPISGQFQSLPFRVREIQLDIHQNSFVSVFLGADLRLNFLEPAAQENWLQFDFHFGKDRTSLTATLENPIDFHLGSSNQNLRFNSLLLHGQRDDQGFQMQGTASGTLLLPPLQVDLDHVELLFAHTEETSLFSFTLQNLTLGPLGEVERGLFILETALDENGDTRIKHLRLETELAWQDLVDRLNLDQTPNFFPLPPDSAEVTATLSWQDSGEMLLSFATAAENPDQVWRFIPQPYAPQVPEATFIFEAAYDEVTHFDGGDPNADIEDDDHLSIHLAAEMAIHLPDFPTLPGLDLIELNTGNSDGLIRARMFGAFEEGEENQLVVGMRMENPLSLSLRLPGTSPEQPLIHCALQEVEMQFESEDDGEQSLGGEMRFSGEFGFNPIIPLDLPFAPHLNSLMQQLGLDQTLGEALVRLGFTEDSFDLEIHGKFVDFGIDLDVFQLLNTLAPSGGDEANNAIEVDFDVSFHLMGFTFKLGYDGNDNDDFNFSFNLNVECKLTGLPPIMAAITLSDEEFSFGLQNLSIPITIPKYPIDVDDLNRLTDTNMSWSLEDGTPGQNFLLELLQEETRLAEEIAGGTLSANEAFNLRKELTALEIKRLMLEIVMAIHKGVTAAGDDAAKTYQDLVVADTWLHSTVMNFIHFDTNLILFFPAIKFRIPFDNPGGIAISGSGKLMGFSEDDPLKSLEDYTFSLGLSSQYIFARIESTGAPIPLPSFGTKYDDGSISISTFMIGYGYTKNSFAFDFAGELVLPTQLIEDADTSNQLGFGVKPPRYNKLAFQLDMMVFTIGKATVAVPIPRFDLDLRSPDAPDFEDLQHCIPHWDGLEIIAKNLLHADVKHLAFSPFFGLSLTPNLKFDGDFVLGDEQNGLSLILNDILILFGTYAGSSLLLPIPFFASPDQPYFRNICANLRLLGFGINFNLERPFPSPSPLALLEAFGLISNPMMEIDPHGPLANSIRFTMSNGTIQVPDYLLNMFPEAANLANTTHGFTLNLGTLITIVQTLIKVVDPMLESTQTFLEDGSQSLNDWQDNLPDSFDPWELLGLLPPELRTISLKNGQMAGFAANARFVICTETEAKAALNNSGPSAPAPLEPPQLTESENSLVHYARGATLFTPVTTDDFSTVWSQQGITGNWVQSHGQIVQQGSLNGISYLIFEEDLSETFTLTIRLDSLPENGNRATGMVLSYTDTDTHYLLRASTGESGEVQLILQRKKSGNFLSEPLMEKSLPPDHTPHQLELLTYLHNQEQHFILNRVVLARRSAASSDAEEIYRIQLGQAVDTAPLAKGKVGLYAKNFSEARFSRMEIGSLSLTSRNFKSIDGQEFNVNLVESKLSEHRQVRKDEALTLFSHEEFQNFNEDLLEKIPVDKLSHQGGAMGSVFLGSRLTVFENQEFNFFGKLFEDGSFALISEAETRPLTLSVLGIPIGIPFRGYTHLLAVGWPESNRFAGFVEAGGWFTWEPIPKAVRIEMGSAGSPCTLRLESSGQFNISSEASLQLFDGAAHIEGEAQLSNNQCIFSGRLHHSFGNIITLEIDGEGGLGQRPKLWFEGQGNISLFGKEVTGISVELSEKRVRTSFTLESGILPHFSFLDNSFQLGMQLSGEVDISRNDRPQFMFSGDGSLTLFGARLQGSCSLRRQTGNTPGDDYSEIELAGRLWWQEREWLQGKMVLNSRTGFHLEGHTRFGLPLSPGQIGGIDVASLFFTISLGGSMTMSPNGNFHFDMQLEWSLAIALPGNDRQLLTVAADDIHLSGALSSPLQLINLKGFKLLPMDGIKMSLPIPKIKGKGDPVLLVGVKNDKIAINVPQLGTLYLDEAEFVTGLTGGSLPSLNQGKLPSLSKGNLPSLSPGSLPSLSRGSLPSLNINFLQGRYSFSAGSLPSLSPGTLPSLNKGSLPSLDKGSLPKLTKGSFPKLKKTSLPLPAYTTTRSFDTGTKPTAIHTQFDVTWKEEAVALDLQAFQSMPIHFGFEKAKKEFYLKIGNKKYSLTGKTL